MISMLALLKLLNFVTVLEDVHANATRFCILRGVVFETPGYVWDPSNIGCRQASSYLATILFFQLQELLVGHIVGIHVLNSRRLPTFFESFLKHFFFSSRRMILLSHCKHVTHHHLKQHVPFSMSFFDLLTSGTDYACAFFFFFLFFRWVIGEVSSPKIWHITLIFTDLQFIHFKHSHLLLKVLYLLCVHSFVWAEHLYLRFLFSDFIILFNGLLKKT